jgi:hypothetical protein
MEAGGTAMAITEERHQQESQDPRKSDLALREFVERVQQLPGVLEVQTFGIGPNVRVVVPSRWSDVEDSVYEIERETLDKYPRSGLDVWVSVPRSSKQPDPGSRGQADADTSST